MLGSAESGKHTLCGLLHFTSLYGRSFIQPIKSTIFIIIHSDQKCSTGWPESRNYTVLGLLLCIAQPRVRLVIVQTVRCPLNIPMQSI